MPVRVYYEDTDAEGVVYYANYLRYLERARTEWLRDLGFDVPRVAREHGSAFVVSRVELDFRAPARLDERLDCTVEPRGAGASRLVLRQRVVRAGTVLCEGVVTLGCVDTRTWRPVRMPSALRERLAGAGA